VDTLERPPQAAPDFKQKTSIPILPEMIQRAVAISKFTNFYNTLGICFFGVYIGIDRLPLFEWTNAATGWSRTPEEYMQIGHRIQTLRQLFNIKQGVSPKDIKVSRRALGIPPQASGPNQGNQIDYPAMRRMYWDQIGWDPESGIPTRKTLIELGLEDRVEGWEENMAYRITEQLSRLPGLRAPMPHPGD
jgi:aldehyde:ferredoxin oxidoreductase